MQRASSPVSSFRYGQIHGNENDGPISSPKTREVIVTQQIRQSDEKSTIRVNESSRFIWFIWWYETLCAVVAVGALAAIVAVVKSFDNTPLPEWPHRISINSIIAIASVVMKTACGFILAEGIGHIKWTNLTRPRSLRSFYIHDEASRGPWGAAHLLWNDKLRHVSSLGAITIILILFLEPFSQQIVSFPRCDRVNETVVGTIPRTNFYEEKAWRMGTSSNVPWAVRKAVNEGLYSTNKPQLSFSCGTGNCTFHSAYSSVAFCSKCEDVTGKLVHEPLPTRNGTNITDLPEAFRHPNVTLPSGDGSTSDGNLTLSIVASNGVSVEEQRRVLVARGGSKSIDIIRSLNSTAYVAQSCRIDPCVRTYTGQVFLGQLREELQDQIFLQQNTEYGAFLVADLNCVGQDEKQQLEEMGYDLKAHPRWLPYNVTASWNSSTGLEEFRGQCTYIPKDKLNKFCDKKEVEPINDDDVEAEADGSSFRLKDNVARLVPSQCIYSMDVPTGTSLYGDLFRDLFANDWRENYYGVEEYWSFSPPAVFGVEPLMAIYNAGSGNGTIEDISGLMKNISDTLTLHVRHNGRENMTSPMRGSVNYTTVCIKVEWRWISFAGASVAATLVFLIWAIIQARLDQARLRKAWEREGLHAPFHDFKSNALTLLYHGLDDHSRSELMEVGSVNRTSEMEKRSRSVNVQMVATERGWKLATAIN